MSNPTRQEIETQLQNAVALLEAVRIRGVTATHNVVAKVDELVQSLKGSRAEAVASGADGVRRAYSEAISQPLIRALLGPILLEDARRIGSPSLGVDSLLKDTAGSLWRDFADSGRWIPSRSIVWGAAAAGTNIGNGGIVRATIDRLGNPIESAYSPKDTTVRAVCVRDATRGSTVPGEEVWEIYGRGAGVDSLDERGSGQRIVSASASAASTAAALTNPSFSQATPTTDGATVTDLTGWEITGTIETVSSDTYRPMGREVTARAIRFTGNASIESTRPLRGIDAGRPYLIQVAFKRESSCDGVLDFFVGGEKQQVTLSSQTGWTVLRFDTSNKKIWPNNWGSVLTVKIELSGNTAGTLLVDDVVISPMDFMDGAYYAPIGGSTPFQALDSFEWADSEPGGALIQRWISRGWGSYLPATAPAAQVAASGSRTLTFAAASDTITASSGDFTGDGYKVGMRLTVAGTSSNNGTYTISAVTTTVITVAESLTDEGPLSATATLDATASILDPTVS